MSKVLPHYLLEHILTSPSYGYELQTCFPSIPRSTLYANLKRLQRYGLLCSTKRTPAHAPTRIIYTCTAKGKLYLAQTPYQDGNVRAQLEVTLKKYLVLKRTLATSPYQRGRIR